MLIYEATYLERDASLAATRGQLTAADATRLAAAALTTIDLRVRGASKRGV